MSAKHTKGPWRYDHEPGCYAELMASDYATVALFAGEPSLANARRIVACVNACEGFSIEELEGADLFKDSIESQDLIDGLLEALKQCRLALEPYDDVKPRDWKTDREKLAFAHQAACAAISKAESNITT